MTRRVRKSLQYSMLFHPPPTSGRLTIGGRRICTVCLEHGYHYHMNMNIYIRLHHGRLTIDWWRQATDRLKGDHHTIYTYERLHHGRSPIGGGRLLFAWNVAMTQYIHTNDSPTPICRLGAAGCCLPGKRLSHNIYIRTARSRPFADWARQAAVRLKLKHGHHTIYTYEQLDHGRLTIGCCSPGARPSQYIHTNNSITAV